MLLARSTLPFDELDTEHDLEALLEFGLVRDESEEVARLAVGGIEPDDVNTCRQRDEMDKTISRRWAQLVSAGSRSSGPSVAGAAGPRCRSVPRRARTGRWECRGVLPLGRRTATSTVTPP